VRRASAKSSPLTQVKDHAVKLFLLVLIACLLAVTAALFTLMFRRHEPILGLAGLTAATGAAFLALPYSALRDL